MRCILMVIPLAAALKEREFRKCADTPFCMLHRTSTASDALPWTVDRESVLPTAEPTTEPWRVRLSPPDAAQLPLRMELSVLKSGAVRLHIADDDTLPLEELQTVDPAQSKPEAWDDDMDGEWSGPMVKRGHAVKTRFEPTEPFASDEARATMPCSVKVDPAATGAWMECAGKKEVVRVTFSPLAVALVDPQTGEPLVVFNGRGRLLYEPYRQALSTDSAEATKAEPVTFNSFTDPLPFGSPSVGADVDFPQASHVYGIPERTVAHALPSSLGREPFRLMNLDVFVITARPSPARPSDPAPTRRQTPPVHPCTYGG